MIVHLIDGTYELFRQFYGRRRFTKGEDKYGAVAGVLHTVLQMLETGATHVGVATDHVIESFRNELWDEYKTGEGVEPPLLAQFRELLAGFRKLLADLLECEVSARRERYLRTRLRLAHLPAVKTLSQFDFTFQRSVKKQVIEHLGQLDFLHAKENVILLGPL